LKQAQNAQGLIVLSDIRSFFIIF